MEEGQERDSSSDEQRHIIDDDDMEDSPTDSPDLWMSERNEEDTIGCQWDYHRVWIVRSSITVVDVLFVDLIFIFRYF